MNNMKDRLIDEMLNQVQALIADRVGIRTPSGHNFPPVATAESPEHGAKFKEKIIRHIEWFDQYFEGRAVPEELLPLMVRYAVRQTIEASPVYQDVMSKLDFSQVQDFNHRLDLLMTQGTALEALRAKPSRELPGQYYPTFEHDYHGEFSYALLHMLNRHAIYVRPENLDLMRSIGLNTDTADYISEKEGHFLSWRTASKYGVDSLLPVRKKQFCSALDEHARRDDFDGYVPDNAAGDRPVNVVLWNRNHKKRDPNRRLGLDTVTHIVEQVRTQVGERPIRLLLLGDPGRLVGINEWGRRHDIAILDHRNEHMFPNVVPRPTEAVPKDEQLYFVRNILKKFEPDFLFGVRSGLVALSALVSTPGLQLDMVDAQSTNKVMRVSRVADREYKTRDNRLLQVFARCPVDGLGPHLELRVDSPNPDRASIHEVDQELLRLTIAVMMVTDEQFKPLMHETLASYLSGVPEALQQLRCLLAAYQLSQANLKESARVNEKVSDDSKDDGDDKDRHDGNGDSDDDHDHHDGSGQNRKIPGSTSGGGSSNTSSSHAGSGGLAHGMMHETMLSQHRGMVMDATEFLAQLRQNAMACNEEYSKLNDAEKSALFIDGINHLESEAFQELYLALVSGVSEEEQARVLRYDRFIMFEHALSFSGHLAFLLSQLGDAVSDLFVDDYFLRGALQVEPKQDALAAFKLLKAKVSAVAWPLLCIQDDSVLVRAMTENLGADYAWSQCTKLFEDEKKHVLMTDNFMVFRRAALCENRDVLLSAMQLYLTPEEFEAGINAYGGDVVYQALLADDRACFDAYYPMLNTAAREDLVYRVGAVAPAGSQARFDVYTQVGQTQTIFSASTTVSAAAALHQGSPQRHTKGAPNPNLLTTPPAKTVMQAKGTPSSVTAFKDTPPRDNEGERQGKLSAEDIKGLASHSMSLFSRSDEIGSMISGISLLHDDSAGTNLDDGKDLPPPGGFRLGGDSSST